MQCNVNMFQRMLAFLCAKPQVRQRVLDLHDGGGPDKWPLRELTPAENFMTPCAPWFPPFFLTSPQLSRMPLLQRCSADTSSALPVILLPRPPLSSRRRDRCAPMYSSDTTASKALAAASWLQARFPAAAAVPTATLARVAVIFAMNAFGAPPNYGDPGIIQMHRALGVAGGSVLTEKATKASHGCLDAANAEFHTLPDGSVMLVATADIRRGEGVTIDYREFRLEPLSTRSRRALLKRSKFFTCACARCAAPDPLRALPCPRCGPARDPATGLLPLSAVLEHATGIPGGGRWAAPGAEPVPLDAGATPSPAAAAAVPGAAGDGAASASSSSTSSSSSSGTSSKQQGSNNSSGVRLGEGPPDQYFWRCRDCGGSFTEAEMSALAPPVSGPRPLGPAERGHRLLHAAGAAGAADGVREVGGDVLQRAVHQGAWRGTCCHARRRSCCDDA